MAFTTIQGSGANDATSFVGSQGVDTINIQNVDSAVLTAQAAADVITFQNFRGVASNYTIKGGAGNDTLNTINGAVANLNNSFVNGQKGDDNFGGVNALGSSTNSSILGGQGNDTFTFGNVVFASLVNGNKNADNITTAGTSGSSIFGGQGTDTIITAGNNGSTVFQGDNDNDNFTVVGVFSGSTLNGNAGNDTITTGAVTGFTTSTLFGGAGNDTITAAAGTETVGLTISGDNGIDSVFGGLLTDTVFGGDAADTVFGNTAADTISGGTGSDSFRYTTAATSLGATGTNVDLITDFTNGTDFIQLQTGGGAGALLLGVTLTQGTAAVAALNADVVNATAVNSIGDVLNAIAAQLTNAGAANQAFAGSAADGTVTVARTVSFANGTFAGTYLAVNDSTAAFQAANDLVIRLGTDGVVGVTNAAFSFAA